MKEGQMKYNMKGGLSFSNIAGSVGKSLTQSVTSGIGSITPASIAKTVTNTLMAPGGDLAAAVKAATSLPGKLQTVVKDVAQAPTVIAQAAANAVTQKIDDKLAAAGITTTGAEGTENLGTPTQNDPGSISNFGATGANNEDAVVTTGGGYETVHLTKPPKDPLHVFYLDGRPIYFTDNGKGRVKILPMHTDIEMAKTSSRHKYTKKIKHKGRPKSTKKSRAKGVRKISRKAKQQHSRRRH
jgi:hypothetical protein